MTQIEDICLYRKGGSNGFTEPLYFTFLVNTFLIFSAETDCIYYNNPFLSGDLENERIDLFYKKCDFFLILSLFSLLSLQVLRTYVKYIWR